MMVVLVLVSLAVGSQGPVPAAVVASAWIIGVSLTIPL